MPKITSAGDEERKKSLPGNEFLKLNPLFNRSSELGFNHFDILNPKLQGETFSLHG